MKWLSLAGMLDGLIVAGPWIIAALVWPEHRLVLWVAAIVLWIAGFAAIFLGAALTSMNPSDEQQVPSHK